MTDSRPRFIFIGGLHRSGTTLLASMLDEHPDISGLRNTGVPQDEGQHLQDEMVVADDLGGPGRFAFSSRAHLVESDATDPLIALRLREAWQPYADTTRSHIVEKSPPNLLRFRYLQAVFPDALMIAIVRHPVAVAHATEFWAKSSVQLQLEHWLAAHEKFEGDRAQLQHLKFMRYEDLVRDPAAVLGPITNYLGLKPFAPLANVRGDTNARYFRRYRHSKFVPPRIKNFRDVLHFERRLQDLHYGYSLLDKASN